MSRVEAVTADRLPWLSDDPAPKQPLRRQRDLLLWLIAIVTLVAGISFWFGARSVQQTTRSQQPVPSTTVRLPESRPAEAPQVMLQAPPQVRPAPQPEVRPSPVRDIPISSPRAGKHSNDGSAPKTSSARDERDAVVSTPVAKSQPAFVPPRPWDPRVFQGASGRIVQVGAFGSTLQAKRGWWYMVRAYPAVAHLPAVVRPSQNSRGRTFYRFQVGTTSQAHSEILCQRMQRISLSCAVVGLPWKAKVER